ncbi:MAG: hypothetical protein AB1756_00950 [Acidobacteriota bacterium]
MKSDIMEKFHLTPFSSGFLQAVLVFIYCALVAMVFQNGELWFGKIQEPFVGILLFLLLFCTSALLCVLFVGAYPLRLYLSNPAENLKKALAVLGWSGAWLLLFIFGFFFIIWMA